MAKSKKKAYYAVYRGRKPGVYTSWPECEAQVNGFPGAIHKGFSTMAEAEQFRRNGRLQIGTTTVHLKEQAKRTVQLTKDISDTVDRSVKVFEEWTPPNTTPPVKVFTDGSSRGNGKIGSRAGVGVFFGENDPRNVSERLVGRQTNQRAELTAAIRALESVDSKENLEIYTDSLYTINCVTIWYSAWERRGFVTTARKEVENVDLIKRLKELMDGREGYVKFLHVRGHQGIHGNEMADLLANNGAMKELPDELLEETVVNVS